MADIPSFLSNPHLAPIFRYDNFRLAPLFDAKARKAFLRDDARLEGALQRSRKEGLPPISVLPMAAQFLGVLCRLVGARSVLEVGTLGGYSSIVFAQAGAKVTSIEISPQHRAVAQTNVAGLDVEVLLGAALDVLPQLAAQGRVFDLVFIDADFADMAAHFDWAVRLARPGGAVFLDDVVACMIRDGEVGFDGERRAVEGDGEKGEEGILERIGRDGRVRASFVPTVAAHEMVREPVMNGFVLAVKEEVVG